MMADETSSQQVSAVELDSNGFTVRCQHLMHVGSAMDPIVRCGLEWDSVEHDPVAPDAHPFDNLPPLPDESTAYMGDVVATPPAGSEA